VALWRLPEGVKVLADGSWRVGGFPILHAASLRHLKSRLVFDGDEAYIEDGRRRLPVEVLGPPFEVTVLRLERKEERAFVALDDGSEEAVDGGSLCMNAETGRFESTARSGRARAVFSRSAHQTLIDNLEEEGGSFFLRVGTRRIPVRA
jgi:hypothetical protein